MTAMSKCKLNYKSSLEILSTPESQVQECSVAALRHIFNILNDTADVNVGFAESALFAEKFC